MNRSLLRAACVLVIGIWLINALANTFYWYSAMWWFDIPMHLLGGVFLGLGAGALFFSRIKQLSRHDAVVSVVLVVLILGIGWEFFEYAVQAIVKGGPQLANIPDSIKDVFMDITGGIVASYFVLRTIKRYNGSHERISHERTAR